MVVYFSLVRSQTNINHAILVPVMALRFGMAGAHVFRKAARRVDAGGRTRAGLRREGARREQGCRRVRVRAWHGESRDVHGDGGEKKRPGIV